MGFVVAIDGPAGSGKGTITKLIAEKRNLVSIDTGAMYRCVTLDSLNKGIEPNNIEGIKSVLENINIELTKVNGEQKVFLNGKDVSKEIREDRVINLSILTAFSYLIILFAFIYFTYRRKSPI